MAHRDRVTATRTNDAPSTGVQVAGIEDGAFNDGHVAPPALTAPRPSREGGQASCRAPGISASQASVAAPLSVHTA